MSLGLITIPTKTAATGLYPSTKDEGQPESPHLEWTYTWPPPCLILSEVKPLCPTRHSAVISAYPPCVEFRRPRDMGCKVQNYRIHYWPLTAQALALCPQLWQWHLLPKLSTSPT